MNFIKELKPSSVGINHFRTFEALEVGNGIELSIQASKYHYCSPRKTLGFLEDYDTMELAILKDGRFVNVERVLPTFSMIDELNKSYEGTVFGFVPVEVLEALYNELIKEYN